MKLVLQVRQQQVHSPWSHSARYMQNQGQRGSSCRGQAGCVCLAALPALPINKVNKNWKDKLRWLFKGRRARLREDKVQVLQEAQEDQKLRQALDNTEIIQDVLPEEARQLDFPQASLKRAEEALMKLLQMRELKNLRSASTGDDEMQLRNAIKEARLIDLPPTDVEQAQDALNEMILARERKALKDAMNIRDEAQLRDAISDASKADVPPDEVEKAQKLLSRIKLLRYVDGLEKAIDSNSEGQLREAISVARKAAPNDDSDDAENARFNLALGEAQTALKGIMLAKELKQLQDAVVSKDEEQLREALSQARATDLPESECAKAQEALNSLVLERKLKFLRNAASSADQEQLREAISAGRKAGLPADELDKANDALNALIRARDVQMLQEAVASEDEDTLRRAILDAKQLELPDDEVSNAQLALTELVQRRSIRQLESAISSSSDSELKDAISEARKAGVSEDVLTDAKKTLKQKALAKASKYLEDAKLLQEEDQLRDAIIEARKVDATSQEIQEEVEAAQQVLFRLIQKRQTDDLRRAVARRDETELREAIREARRQDLASDEIEKAQETLAELVVLRKLSWLTTAIQNNDESELRNLLADIRKTESLQDESLQGRIVEALDQGQEALAQIVLEREIENVTQAARTGSETQLQEAIEQAKEANVPIQKLENAMETLNQLTCARMRLDLQSALDSDDEAEIRGALKEARSVLPFEELEEANNKLETLLLLRELSEASTRTALRASLQRAEFRDLAEHPALDVARRKLAAIDNLREVAEQSDDPGTIEAALEQAKRLRVDPDLISSAEGILDREMGIKRFGLKHGVVIEERGGEALPIPYQERFRSEDIFFLLIDVFRSRTLQQVAMPVVICTLWAMVCAAVSSRHHLAEGAWRLNQFLVTPLGLLLTFRTQQSITRFNGAVDLWSKVSSACRTLSRALFYQDARIPLEKHYSLAQQICLFPAVLREHLENRRTNKLLNIRRDDVSKPIALLDQIQAQIFSLKELDVSERNWLLKPVEQLSDLVSPCEMIVQTPVPQSYVRHTGRFLAVWLLSLPLSLASHAGWLMVLIELIASWCLFAIQEIGLRLEDPFNGQIAMNIFIKTVKKEVRQRYVMLLEELLQAHADGHLDDAVNQWSHRFDDKLLEVLEDEQRLETAETRQTMLVAVERGVKQALEA
ncbi:unnamed protein product [Cladocopium goreaui]|uniref:Bestrophin homolog n=1 Tax=Cladocopium goreaui TaxID=2562237 RepID=A0A9P1DKR7_9DINO|nr:unnamed protein product [Cladocopium goreaui]